MTAEGFAALQRGAWREARAPFEASEPTPATLAGLGTAARGQFDGDAALDAHERGYRLALERDEPAVAARIALELVIDCLNSVARRRRTGGWNGQRGCWSRCRSARRTGCSRTSGRTSR